MQIPTHNAKTAATIPTESSAIFLLRRTFGFCFGAAAAVAGFGGVFGAGLTAGAFFAPVVFALFDFGITIVSE